MQVVWTRRSAVHAHTLFTRLSMLHLDLPREHLS